MPLKRCWIYFTLFLDSDSSNDDNNNEEIKPLDTNLVNVSPRVLHHKNYDAEEAYIGSYDLARKSANGQTIEVMPTSMCDATNSITTSKIVNQNSI